MSSGKLIEQYGNEKFRDDVLEVDNPGCGDNRSICRHRLMVYMATKKVMQIGLTI